MRPLHGSQEPDTANITAVKIPGRVRASGSEYELAALPFRANPGPFAAKQAEQSETDFIVEFPFSHFTPPVIDAPSLSGIVHRSYRFQGVLLGRNNPSTPPA